jgi:hypothetical protein
LTHDAYLWHPPSTGIVTGAVLDRLEKDGLISSDFNEEEAKAVKKWRKSHGSKVPIQYVDEALMTMEERRACLEERRTTFLGRWDDLPPVPEQIGNLGDADPSWAESKRRAKKTKSNPKVEDLPNTRGSSNAAATNGHQTVPAEGSPNASASHRAPSSNPGTSQNSDCQPSSLSDAASHSPEETLTTPIRSEQETPSPAQAVQPVVVNVITPTPVSRAPAGKSGLKRSLEDMDNENASAPETPPKRARLFSSKQVSLDDEPGSDVFGEQITNSVSLNSTQKPAVNGVSASIHSSPTPGSRAPQSWKAPAKRAPAGKKRKNVTTRTSRATTTTKGKPSAGNARTARSKPVADQVVQKNARARGKSRTTAAPESKGKKKAVPPSSKTSKAKSKRGKAAVDIAQGVNETSAPPPTKRRNTRVAAAAAEAAVAENAPALEAPAGNLRRSTRLRTAPIRG